MLVLSRRPSEKVLFPNLGISVEILRVEGKAVRLGINAPRDIRILRAEVGDEGRGGGKIGPGVSRHLRHELRNRLNTASLGLQLLRRRMEMGQAVDVESTISRILQQLREIDVQLQSADNGSPDNSPAEPRRALIVEDNANESHLLAEFLRMSGYEVDTVQDGLEALAYLQHNERPDAVLLDMCMPRMNGPKTVSSIRDEPGLQDLKLFAVSGTNRHDVGLDVGPSGVDGWFSKPVNAMELVREMNRVLDQPALTA
jgi:carbon storage regulator CsrA